MNSFLRIEESVITPYHLFTFNKINIMDFFALFYWNLGNDELFWDTCLNFEAIILIIIIIIFIIILWIIYSNVRFPCVQLWAERYILVISVWIGLQ